jgi:hypothetical protein
VGTEYVGVELGVGVILGNQPVFVRRRGARASAASGDHQRGAFITCGLSARTLSWLAGHHQPRGFLVMKLAVLNRLQSESCT